jgi:virulence-associated protein VagC
VRTTCGDLTQALDWCNHKPERSAVEEVNVYDHFGRQVIVLPEEYRFDVETVYLVRDGIALTIIPVNEEGEALVRQRLRDILARRVERPSEE